MPRGRPVNDQEGLRRVLLLCAVLLGLAGVGFATYGLVAGGWGIVAGPVLVVFAVACAVVARDDARGTWCPVCIARNHEDAELCENCGQLLA